jgi:hypothetical protein
MHRSRINPPRLPAALTGGSPIACLLAAAASPLAAAQSLPDKSAYHLFNPVPRELMRDMSTDRPDVTESPITVDAGHVQLEMSFVDLVKDAGSRAWTVAPLNLKLGLLNNADLQLVFDPWVLQRGDADHVSGQGDLQVRLKVNLWGNDPAPGQNTALGIMPFIKIPTADDSIGNDRVEGGLIVPFAMDLGGGWAMGLMAEFDAIWDELDHHYDLEFVHTASLGRDLTDVIGAYVEYIGIAGSDAGSQYRVGLGGGLTFALSPDLQLDFGVIVGLAGGIDDLNLFAGLSIRH